jgi:hypothetical protein
VPGTDLEAFMSHADCLRSLCSAAARDLSFVLHLCTALYCFLGALCRLVDPDYIQYSGNGKEVLPGVIRKVDYAYNGAPISFSCEATYTPIVEEATRTIYHVCNIAGFTHDAALFCLACVARLSTEF